MELGEGYPYPKGSASSRAGQFPEAPTALKARVAVTRPEQ
jgi:hypothetical protein